ncbi:MAG: glutathione S-transferase N-terminal domain-containing protein [Pseudolabrys sp.]|nr:glutathione S-transferase N-terminal domain-containing protein [Pseudolabrys sp.]MDP2293889.1 glutathione S-transferase N-terminal domain-containing protein [Pseudolabrys sp.]
MKLIGSNTSPYVRKVRVYLDEAGLDYDFEVVDAWKPDPSLLVIAPIGKVPILIRPGCEALCESNLILEYLYTLVPAEKRLVPTEGEYRWQVLRLQMLASGMIDAAATRTVELRKPAPTQSPIVVDRELGRIDRLLIAFENIAAPGRFIAGGERMTIADLVLGVALQYLDFRHTPDWRNSAPKLASWLTPITQRPSFKRTLPLEFVTPT